VVLHDLASLAEGETVIRVGFLAVVVRANRVHPHNHILLGEILQSSKEEKEKKKERRRRRGRRKKKEEEERRKKRGKKEGEKKKKLKKMKSLESVNVIQMNLTATCQAV